MSARKRTKRKTGSESKAVTQVVDVSVKVKKTKKRIIPKQRLERGHGLPETEKPQFLPRPLDAATIVDRQSLREMATWRLQERPDAWKSFEKLASLEKLVSLERSRDFLLDALATLALTNTAGKGFKATFGRSKREIEAVMRRMLRCAKDVEDLPGIWGDQRNQVSSLPTVLRDAAERLRVVALKRRKRGRRDYDAALAAIVYYVQKTMQGSHNSDVAKMVAAMRGDEYSEEAHKDWLKKHKALVLNPWGR